MGGSLPETMSAGSNDEEFYGRRQQKWIIQPKTEAKWWNIDWLVVSNIFYFP